MGFFGVKIFFFASQHSRIFFSRQLVTTLFFFYKNNIFQAQSANRIFVLPISETECFLLIKYANRNCFSQKKTFKLNGCSLRSHVIHINPPSVGGRLPHFGPISLLENISLEGNKCLPFYKRYA